MQRIRDIEGCSPIVMTSSLRPSLVSPQSYFFTYLFNVRGPTSAP